MIRQSTIDKLHDMRLSAMSDAFERQCADPGIYQADLAIHDPKRSDDKEPNPHMHIMVPIRPLKKDGTWDVKQKKIPILKEDGTPILNKNGKPKMKAVPVNDWSSKEIDLDAEGKKLKISDRTMRDARRKLEDELDYGFENSKKTVCLKK